MPKATLDRLRGGSFRRQLHITCSLTEAFRSTYLDPAQVDRRPNSISEAIPNAEIVVVHQMGQAVSLVRKAKLVHRGPLVALGYWGRPCSHGRAVQAGAWYSARLRAPELAVWSGDTVVADEDGYLYFVGRRDEMIKTSGYRVSPTEVEEVAYDSGLVRDAVALGVDDDRLGQRIVLLATAANGQLDPSALIAQMRRKLPYIWCPPWSKYETSCRVTERQVRQGSTEV